jgi:hypothetical protein
MILDGKADGHLTSTFATGEDGGSLQAFRSIHSKLHSDVVIHLNNIISNTVSLMV